MPRDAILSDNGHDFSRLILELKEKKMVQSFCWLFFVRILRNKTLEFLQWSGVPLPERLVPLVIMGHPIKDSSKTLPTSQQYGIEGVWVPVMPRGAILKRRIKFQENCAKDLELNLYFAAPAMPIHNAAIGSEPDCNSFRRPEGRRLEPLGK